MAAPLDAYRKKRNFAVTSEPRGGKSRSKGNLFVVQKHDATRLHYDFRLEFDGVLKSWAVTRGPSLVPGEKRLAVHVEDHPLDYGSFEGTIPGGQYGAGTVLLWDSGTWTPEGDPHKGYAKGHLDFTLHGKKLKGEWHLVRMRPRRGEKGDNWLLIKAHDAEARTPEDADILEEKPDSVASGQSLEEIAGNRRSRQWTSGKAARESLTTAAVTPRERARAPLDPPPAAKTSAKISAKTSAKTAKTKPAAKTAKADAAKRIVAFTFKAPKAAKRAALPKFIPPMLPALTSAPPKGADWIHEIKFDGYRIESVVRAGKATLLTRTGLNWTDRFPAVAEVIAALPVKTCVIDGEIVVEDANGISDFSALQNALKEGEADALVYYVFDLLYLDDLDLTRAPLAERKDLLTRLVAAAASKRLRVSEDFEQDGALMLQHICRLGAEGIISKKRDGTYVSGRGTGWIKAKCADRQEFVILGYVPSTTAPKAVGSLALGYYDKGKLMHAGRVGSGFSNKLAGELFAELSRDRIAKPPVTQALSAEARRNVVWISPTHVAEVEFRGWTADSNVRQASFKGLREDKDPKEIVREKAAATPAKNSSTRTPTPVTDVKLTHPDRVLWPEAGVTKQGLADYYMMAWPWIEKHIKGRPLVLLRCPSGIVQGCFFQKHAWAGIDKHIKQIRDPDEKEPILGIDSLDGLMALVQTSALEIHPWGARSDDLDHPDRLIFDLDPGEDVAFSDLIAAAREVRARLAEAKLESFVKTTGGKGLHVVAPIKATTTWQAAKAFCRKLAEAMTRDSPQRFIATATKSARAGRIYVDYLRNARGATAVAAYSTRARESAGISMPLAWDELGNTTSASQFTLGNIGNRLQYLADDPWPDFFSLRQSLPRRAAS